MKHTPLMIVSWAWVGAPFVYGVVQLVKKVALLFA